MSNVVNIEADVSQDVNKRFIFHQALDSTAARLLIINDAFMPEVQENLKDKAIFVENTKNDLFLTHELISSPSKRDALAKAYRSLDVVHQTKRGVSYISSFLVLLDAVAQNNKELLPFTLGSWQGMSDKDLLAEVKQPDYSKLPAKNFAMVKALIKTFEKSSEGVHSFRQLSRVIWTLHAHLMVRGRFNDPIDWIGNKNLLVLSASAITKSKYAKLTYQFALESNQETYIDSLVDFATYSSFLGVSKSNLYISLQKDFKRSEIDNIAYTADQLFVSLESFDTGLFVSWLAKKEPKLLKKYSYSDFERVFTEFHYASYLNSYLGVEDNQLYLYRINNKNALDKRQFDLSVILKQLGKMKRPEATSKPENSLDESKVTEIIHIEIATQLKPIISKIDSLYDKLQSNLNAAKNVSTTSDETESDQIDRIFEQTLQAQKDSPSDYTF